VPSTKNQRGDISTTGDIITVKEGSNETDITNTNATGSPIAVNLPGNAGTLVCYDIAQSWTGVQTFNHGKFLISDTSDTYTLDLKWNDSSPTANRTLNIDINDADRTVDLSANLVLGSSAGLTTATGAITLTGDAGGSSALTLKNATSVVGGNSNNEDILTRTDTQSGITNKSFTTPILTTPQVAAGTNLDTNSPGTFQIGPTNMTALTITPDVTITGNLTVNGTTTTLNTATMTIDDPNLLLNSGVGDNGDGAGLTVESTGTDHSLVTETALASNWKCGVVGSEKEIVTVSDTQTLTGKTYDAEGTGNSLSNITNTHIKATAAIARTKIANGTADHVIINDGSGTFSSEPTLAVSRGGTGQASASAAFDALAPSAVQGDIIAYNGSTWVALNDGTNGQVLLTDTAQATNLRWGTAVGTTVLVATGDIIYSSDGSGTPANLTIGSNNSVMYAASGIPAWSNISNLSWDGTTLATTAFTCDGAATFNDSGADVDFKVEAQTREYMLFVDASAKAVGVNTGTPTARMDIYNHDSGTLTLQAISERASFGIAKIRSTAATYTGANAQILAIDADVTAATGFNFIRCRSDSSGTQRFAVDGTGGITVHAPAATAGLLTLQTGETTVVDGDILGQIDFQAPDEITDSDSRLVGASIWAEADDIFSASNNSTELVFATASSETAAEKMRLDKDGNLGLGTATPSLIGHTLTQTIETTATGDAALELSGNRSIDGGVGAVEFINNNGGTFRLGIIDVSRHDADNSGQMQFYTGAAGTPTLAMTIDPAQNVGIGTASPTGKTHISQTADAIGLNLDCTHATYTSICADIQATRADNSGYTLMRIGNGTSADGLAVTGERNVGIRTASPQCPLHVLAGGTAGTPALSSEQVATFQNSATAGTSMAINIISGNTGSAAIGFGDSDSKNDAIIAYDNNAQELKFQVNAAGLRLSIDSSGHTKPGADNTYTCGTDANEWSAIWATNTTIQSSSDRRLKTNINPLTNSLGKILQLKPSTYDWIMGNDNRETTGFIAQEVRDVFPEMVIETSKEVENEENLLAVGVSGNVMVAHLVRAIQELSDKVTVLENS
jgi:hypothetical protein